MTPSAASLLTTLVFCVLVVSVLACFLLGLQRAGKQLQLDEGARRRQTLWGVALVLAALLVPGLAVGSGVLQNFDSIPPMLLRLVLPTFLATFLLACSPVGARFARGLGVVGLVGFQSFRLPLELVLHRWHDEGHLPREMTFAGWNFDILTGLGALIIGLWATRGPVPRRVLQAWNVLGLVLLVTVVSIAISSFPAPFALFDTRLTLVTHLPYIYLPTILVPAALFGHVVMFRHLAAAPRAAQR